MTPHLQELLILAGVFSALTTALGAVVAALCYFLRRLCATIERIHDVRIPAMLEAFKAEQGEERKLCREQVATLARQHQELLDWLRGQSSHLPFAS